MSILGSKELIRWSCPVNLTTGPKPDPDGSRTLVKVIDTAGNNFEIRCMRGVGGWNHWYSYSISFPTGAIEEISKCIYLLGLNDVELIYTGATTETTGPTGTPIINVGAIQMVEHSNTETSGGAITGLTPKKNGKDFQMVYDYRQKFRYRLNTVVGKGAESTDDFESRAFSPTHTIMHAEATPVPLLEDFKPAMDSNLRFRRLDDRSAQEPREYGHQDVDTDDSPIGYTFLDGGETSGAIILDPSMKGSSFHHNRFAIEGHVPAQDWRSRSTFAVERRLFRRGGQRLTVTLDGRRLPNVITRPTESMVMLELPLSPEAHSIRITDNTPAK